MAMDDESRRHHTLRTTRVHACVHHDHDGDRHHSPDLVDEQVPNVLGRDAPEVDGALLADGLVGGPAHGGEERVRQGLQQQRQA